MKGLILAISTLAFSMMIFEFVATIASHKRRSLVDIAVSAKTLQQKIHPATSLATAGFPHSKSGEVWL